MQFNMTPMIDVVFLLIIFFMVSSHLAKQEIQAEVDLPTATTGTEQRDEENRRVTINVMPEGNGYVLKLGTVPVKPEKLRERIVDLRDRAKRNGRELEVRIRSDRSAPYRIVEPILLACAKSGVWNVNFAVVQKGTGNQ